MLWSRQEARKLRALCIAANLFQLVPQSVHEIAVFIQHGLLALGYVPYSAHSPWTADLDIPMLSKLEVDTPGRLPLVCLSTALGRGGA